MQETQDVPKPQNDRNTSFTQLPLYLTRTTATLIVAVGLFAATGCNRSHNADVVATVNGHAIMRADLEKRYAVQLGNAQQQQPHQQPTKEQADALRLQALHDLIDIEMIEQRAAKMNLTATNEEVDAKIAEMKAPFPSEEAFEQKLKESNQTLDELKHDVRRGLTSNKLLNKEINSKITVTDADVANYFNQHKSEFNLVETNYRLAQILVTDTPSAQPGNLQGSKATNDVEAEKKIKALKNRLESGEDFGALAMNFSESPETSPGGGDMGFVADSQMRRDPEIYAAISKLKPGEITNVLPIMDPQTKKPAGYAIFKVLSRDPAGQRDLSDPRVQQTIRQQLQESRSQLLKAAYYEMLRDQTKVENFYAEQIFKNAAH
jgi:peptidyl-prolyl cis-trans isomerase SurA